MSTGFRDWACAVYAIKKKEAQMERLALNKDYIRSRDITLANLSTILASIFKSVREVSNADLVVCLGNTGCGKSSLLSAIVHGTDKMVIKTLQEEIQVGRGRNKRTKIKEVEVIDCTEPDNIFKIGHSDSQSETFIPNVWFDMKSGLTFADVAGLNDTGGDFIEIINNFVIKYIFSKARSVRFLIPLTVDSIYESRGQVLSE